MKHPHQIGYVNPNAFTGDNVQNILVNSWKFMAGKEDGKIEAIKIYRILYDCDLFSAKKGVEHYIDTLTIQKRAREVDEIKKAFLRGGSISVPATIRGLIDIGVVNPKELVTSWVNEIELT